MTTTHQPLALITGANRGIDKEVSRQLAAQGFAVPLAPHSLFGSRNLIRNRAVEDVDGTIGKRVDQIFSWMKFLHLSFFAQ